MNFRLDLKNVAFVLKLRKVVIRTMLSKNAANERIDYVAKNKQANEQNKKTKCNFRLNGTGWLPLTFCGRAEVTIVIECFYFKWRQLSAVHVHLIQCVNISHGPIVFTKRRIAVPVL